MLFVVGKLSLPATCTACLGSRLRCQAGSGIFRRGRLDRKQEAHWHASPLNPAFVILNGETNIEIESEL